MTEKELRNKIVTIAKQYYGCNEKDGSFKQIIDTYNSVSPLPRGYKVKYTDEWCATYVSAIGMYAGLSDIIYRECGCGEMVNLYKKVGRWVENDAYVPNAGDIIMYDWQDSGTGNNTGHPDHVGIVVSVSNNIIKVIEGNRGEAVAYRDIAVNGKNIRGYCIPNYASKATSSPAPTPTVNPSPAKLKYKVGDIVEFIGNTHYVSANSTTPKSCKSGRAKVTAVYDGGRHPYHLVATSSVSTVHGWVNETDIKGSTSATPANPTNTSSAGSSSVKIEDAKSYNKSIAGTYKTTTALNLRAGAGTNKKILTTIPKNGVVKCYGYYTNAEGVNWYYVVYDKYKGYVSSKYLTK